MNHLDITRKTPTAQEIMKQLIEAESKKCAKYRHDALQDFTRYVMPFLEWRKAEVNKKIQEQIKQLPTYRRPIKEKYLHLIRKYITLRQKYYKAVQLLRYNKQKYAND